MVFAGWQATIVDDAGNVVPSAAIEVLRELPGLPPAQCFSDKTGSTPIGSTFNADAEGFVRFYAAGGFYRITATLGGFSREWRDVAIGTAAGTDASVLPVAVPPTWLFATATADADPGAGLFRLNNASVGSATAAYIDNMTAGGASVLVWLDMLDDFGGSTSRGVLTIFDPNNPTTVFRIFTVSGSVVDGGGYRKVTIAHMSGAGSFLEGEAYQFVFSARGPVGTGDVTGPNGGVLAGHVAVYADTTGKLIGSAGAGPLLQGSHVIGYWPARGLTRPTTTPAGALAQSESTANDVNDEYLPFANGSTTHAGFAFRAPESLNEASTLTAEIEWMEAASATAHVCRWQVEMQAQGDGDTIDAAWGTAVAVDDTGSANTRRFVVTGAITPAGSWATRDKIHVRVARLGGHANDTLDVAAHLIGVTLKATVNAGAD